MLHCNIPHNPCIILTYHLQNSSSSFFKDQPILFYQLVKRSFDGITTSCKFRATCGTLVLLLLDYVPLSTCRTEGVLKKR